MSEALSKPKADEEDGPIIEIEDDAPREAGRSQGEADLPIDSEVPTDEELASYAPSTRSRINKLRAQYHQERREKEAVSRQNQEAIRLVKHLQGELQRTRGFARSRDKEALSGAQAAVESQLAAARRDVTDAFTNGETEKFGEASERVARLAAHAERLKMTQPAIPEEADEPDRGGGEAFGGMRGDAKTASELEASPDVKAVAWGARNPWFGQDKRLTALAYAIHGELVEQGDVAIGSDTYYKSLDSELRRAAPAQFEDAGSDGRREGRSQGGQVRREGRSAPTASSVVSSGGRSSVGSGARKVVRITQSQADIARKLGVSNEQYVAELMKLEVE